MTLCCRVFGAGSAVMGQAPVIPAKAGLSRKTSPWAAAWAPSPRLAALTGGDGPEVVFIEYQVQVQVQQTGGVRQHSRNQALQVHQAQSPAFSGEEPGLGAVVQDVDHDEVRQADAGHWAVFFGRRST